MRSIDLSVLFVDTISSRIYLSLLEKKGFKPKKVLFLTILPTSSAHKLLVRILGERLSIKVLSLYRRLKQRVPESLSSRLLAQFDLSHEDLDGCLDRLPKGCVEKLRVKGINDSLVREYITSAENKIFLFTGGGILHPDILSVSGSKFIHIHPGIVPEVRGADCFFWSYLVRRKAGYSVFFMKPGIDTGDVLYKREYEVNLLDITLSKYSNTILYSALLNFYDPCLRAMTLINLLSGSFTNTTSQIKACDLRNLPYKQQCVEEGRTYFFMHKRLVDFTINKLKAEG